MVDQVQPRGQNVVKIQIFAARKESPESQTGVYRSFLSVAVTLLWKFIDNFRKNHRMTSVDICTFNDFVQQYELQNNCGHTTRNIKHDDFEQIADLYDPRVSTINYLTLVSPDPKQIYLGCYPYHGCKLLRCKTCGMLVFFQINHGGVAPFFEYFLVEKDKMYRHEPATISVSLQETKLEQFKQEFPVFTPKMWNAPANTDTLRDVPVSFYSVLNLRARIVDETQLLVFDIVADRQTLINVHQWTTNVLS